MRWLNMFNSLVSCLNPTNSDEQINELNYFTLIMYKCLQMWVKALRQFPTINVQCVFCRERKKTQRPRRNGKRERDKRKWLNTYSWCNGCIKTEENQTTEENYLSETPRIVTQYQQSPHILFSLFMILNVEEVLVSVSRTQKCRECNIPASY